MTTTVERTGRRRRTALRAFGRTGVTLLGVAISVLLAAPIFWVIVTSLKDATGIDAMATSRLTPESNRAAKRPGWNELPARVRAAR